jgi:hypothetical protein
MFLLSFPTRMGVYCPGMGCGSQPHSYLLTIYYYFHVSFDCVQYTYLENVVNNLTDLSVCMCINSVN